MDVNVDLSSVQGRVTKRAKRARRLSHKMVLASLGVVGLTFDAGVSVIRGAGGLVHKAEVRGEKMEARFSTRVTEVQDQMTEEARARRAAVEERVNSISQTVGERRKDVEKQVQSKISALKIGSGTVVETDQIRIEVEVVESEPWEGYDSLNAQEVIDHLTGLEDAKLEDVRRYETNTKDRVTVLREIDLRQAAIKENKSASKTDAGTPEGGSGQEKS